jgi:GAF domain-containing protein
MSQGPRPAASVADLAAIELRRIIDVLQVEHASLFLHDSDHPQRAAAVAATGIPVDEALVEYGGVVARVMHTGRVHEIDHPHGSARGGCSAMAVPLLEGHRPIGVLLVVTVRDSRRLGTFDAQVIVRAAQTLVSRIVSRERRFHRESAAPRFTRAGSESDPLQSYL